MKESLQWALAALALLGVCLAFWLVSRRPEPVPLMENAATRPSQEIQRRVVNQKLTQIGHITRFFQFDQESGHKGSAGNRA